MFISFGLGAIIVRSSKQKLNGKLSIKAEMIAISDGLNNVL